MISMFLKFLVSCLRFSRRVVLWNTAKAVVKTAVVLNLHRFGKKMNDIFTYIYWRIDHLEFLIFLKRIQYENNK